MTESRNGSQNGSELGASSPAKPIIQFREVSKWYGNVIGVNKLTLDIAPGVTGLLGPNGAGKSTFLQLATGQLRPSQGALRVLGREPWNSPDLNRSIGLCPEQDAFYEWMTGFEFVHFCGRLAGLHGAAGRDAAHEAIRLVGMTENMNRPIKGYSKGMRQRIKLAQSIVHDPDVLFLDEPLTGTDPVARHELVQIIMELGRRGKSVIVSSHVLHEVEGMTPNIILLNRGKLVAEGNTRQIRDLIDHHPHRIVLICEQYRELAGQLVAFDDVVGVDVLAKEGGILVETNKPDAFYSRLAGLSLARSSPIRQVYSDDDNLEAVFKYLVNP